MQVITLKVGVLETNCYILAAGSKAAVIDPGDDGVKILDWLKRRQLEVQYIFNTHGHHDHILANGTLGRFAKKSIYIHPADEQRMEKDYSTLPLNDGEHFEFAHHKISVIHTPGHTPGSVSFLVDGNLFCGDLLFKQSIGRTDFAEASPPDMIESLKKVARLDPQTNVYPGHGAKTTIGDELNENPFLLELDL